MLLQQEGDSVFSQNQSHIVLSSTTFSQPSIFDYDYKIEKVNIGKYLSNVTEVLIEDDNKKYKITVANKISGRDNAMLCRKEIQINKNKFCTKVMSMELQNCSTNDRNNDK